MAWQVQQAKQRLSEVLRAAEAGTPQVISRHGEDVAVVLDIASYRRLAGVEVELGEFLAHGPSFDDLDLGAVRSTDLPRAVDLGGPAVAADA